jgi:hypothetical protein
MLPKVLKMSEKSRQMIVGAPDTEFGPGESVGLKFFLAGHPNQLPKQPDDIT